MRHGGQILIHQLKVQGCTQVYSVPGADTTSILEGLYEIGQVQTITCRHENNAAIMAEAQGRLAKKPGVCLVSGISGALKASIALQIAQQNASPMILLVALPDRVYDNCETANTSALLSPFSAIVKDAAVIEDTARIPEYLNRAYKVALSGKPGPVILGLPENIIKNRAHTDDLKPAPIPSSAPSDSDMQQFLQMLNSASRPVMIIGGPGWNTQTAENIERFAEKFKIPVFSAYNCQDYLDNNHTHYTGTLSPDLPDTLAQYIINADLIIALGTELDRKTTNNRKIIQAPQPLQQLIQIHPVATELGRVFQPALPIQASSEQFSEKLLKQTPPQRIQWEHWQEEARQHYQLTTQAEDSPGEVKLEYIVRVLKEVLPGNSIITHGSGNYASWLHRYFTYEQYGTQLAPHNESPEYAIPAAIASKLSTPQRTIVAITGDGGFMMSAAELSTAMHYGLKIIVIIVNNNMFGSARKQQEMAYPGHVLGTSLTNPDFIKLTESYGAEAEIVEHRKAFRTVLKRALTAKNSTVIELRIDENAVSPDLTLNNLNNSN